MGPPMLLYDKAQSACRAQSMYNIRNNAETAAAPMAPPSSSSFNNINNARAKSIPPYPLRRKERFTPIDLDDFDGGGSYPELHIVQYPLNIGRPGTSSTAVVSVVVNKDGEVSYDAIVKQGKNRNKQLIQTSLSDMKGKEVDGDAVQLPSEKEEAETAEKTRLALEALLHSKIRAKNSASGKDSNANVPGDTAEGGPTYVRYTANPDAPGFNPEVRQRVIKLVEEQVDPMEPPKHKHTKAPKGPGSPPVPVLHSPPRKLTAADHQAWKIPPVISNWKNTGGFTVPLDKRLAADGRGTQETSINNKFAMLSEALYVSERKAAEELRMRNQIRKKMAIKEKEEKEVKLRELALKARMERSGIIASALGGDEGENENDNDDFDTDNDIDDTYRGNGHGNGSHHGDDESVRTGAASRADPNETEDERVARLQRERLRVERRMQRERELRRENMGAARKGKADRDGERDISEKIALGLHKGGGATGEAQYDSRLFNQSAGLDSGFGADDDYAVYTKPLFSDKGAAGGVYRPKAGDTDIYGDADAQLAKLADTSKFKPDKGFKGAEAGAMGYGLKRSEPVQFEKTATTSAAADPFGIDDIIQSKKARHE